MQLKRNLRIAFFIGATLFPAAPVLACGQDQHLVNQMVESNARFIFAVGADAALCILVSLAFVSFSLLTLRALSQVQAS